MNLITINDALQQIKSSIENAITTNGTAGKNNLIRTQKPIKLIHEAVKSELIRHSVNPRLIFPQLSESSGELALSGRLKRKNQDICVAANDITRIQETITYDGLLQGELDIYGKNFTEKVLSINVRSQLSSSAKNFDTLYERTFAEALNFHLRFPKMVLGEVYMIAVREYDENQAKNKIVAYKNIQNVESHIEKYLLAFQHLNDRMNESDPLYKYERVCLLIADFAQTPPKIYSSNNELYLDNLLSRTSTATISGLDFSSFVNDLITVYNQRFGIGKFS